MTSDLTSIEARLQNVEKQFEDLGTKVNHRLIGASGGSELNPPIQQLVSDLQEIKKEYASVTKELELLKQQQKSDMENIIEEFDKMSSMAELFHQNSGIDGRTVSSKQ